MPNIYHLRGRDFNSKDIYLIKQITENFYDKGRTEISRQICKRLNWKQPNGWLKDRACRDVLLRLHEKKIIKLPISRKTNKSSQKTNENQIKKKWLKKMQPITDYFRPEIKLVKGTAEEKTWNELVKTFHYQSYSVIVGKNMKYIAYHKNLPVACFGWGSAAWAVEARDKWLNDKFGWDRKIIIKNLPKIINNVRFLILPWIKVQNLASTMLSMMEKIVKQDWLEYYNIKPILLETFVEQKRFRGTCYKAANWQHIGITKGNSKNGNSWSKHNNIKNMYIKPLSK